MRSGVKFISFLIISPASWQSAWRMVNTQQCLLSQLMCSKWFLLEIFFWPCRYQKYAYLKIWCQSFTNLASVCISVMVSLSLSTLWQVGARCSQPYRIPSFLPSFLTLQLLRLPCGGENLGQPLKAPSQEYKRIHRVVSHFLCHLWGPVNVRSTANV